MRTYHVTITGTQPLLMHNDDIEWADQMDAWKLDKGNKKKSKAGDDRSPAHRWMGCLYRDDAGDIVLPVENLMRTLMEGATAVLVPGGKSGKTFKAQSQSGILPRAYGWPLMNAGKPMRFGPLERLVREEDFAVHQQAVRDLGFELFLKRAKIGQSKHVRVRPRFDSWQAAGELVVIDDQITASVLSDILEVAGTYKGIGDWRPSSRTPGRFGTFTADVEPVA